MSVEEVREAMLNIYKSNITSNLGYLLLVVVGFIGILNVEMFFNLLSSFNYLPLSIFIFVFIFFTLYFFGRAIYYASLSEAVVYVEPYNKINLKKYRKHVADIINRKGAEYNLFLSFNEACHDFLRRKNIYKNYPKNKKYECIVFLEDSLKSFIIFVIFSIELGIIFWTYYNIFFVN